MKSDTSVHNICIAAIKRHTMKPYDFKWTRFYEEPEDLLIRYPGIINIGEGERPICSTIINSNNWSILSTQRIFTQMNGKLTIGNMNNSENLSYGDFKGYEKNETTIGSILLANGIKLGYFIETGKASMVMIYGISTRISIC